MQLSLFRSDGLKIIDADETRTFQPEPADIVWIDVHQPDMDCMRWLQEKYRFHPLAIEDTLNQQQRPKVEEYADHLFIIANAVASRNGEIEFQELDIFLGKNYIITVHNDCARIIQEARQRLERSAIFRHVSSEYLLYLVMDAVVDGYFPIVEMVDDEIEEAGESLLRRTTPQLLERLLQLRRLLGQMWYIIEQQHGMFNVLTRREEDLLTHHEVLEYYLRDVDDHLHRLLSNVSLLRESLTSIVEMYLSAASYHLNQVVNRLTVITITIGIFTVFGGIYGMNFTRTWPPFEAEWGALFAIATMSAVSILALMIFRRMKWF